MIPNGPSKGVDLATQESLGEANYICASWVGDLETLGQGTGQSPGVTCFPGGFDIHLGLATAEKTAFNEELNLG